MKTAVDFLVKEFSDMLGPLDIKPMQDLLLVDAIKRAKEMEKDQICASYVYGSAYGIDIDNNLSPQNYYNKTFNHESNN